MGINDRKVTVGFMHREPGTVFITLEVQIFCLKPVPKILFSVSLSSRDQIPFTPQVFSKCDISLGWFRSTQSPIFAVKNTKHPKCNGQAIMHNNIVLDRENQLL